MKNDLKNLFSNFKRIQIGESLLKRPLDDETIAKTVLSGFNSNVIIDCIVGNDKINKRDRLLIYKQYNEFVKSIAGEGFNPKKTYEGGKYFVDIPSNKKRLDGIFDAFDGKFDSNFYYEGDKGSGKTITNNSWLENNNDKLEERKIFWVRCDAQKVYDMWKKANPLLEYCNFITLKEYLGFQFLYVFAKYIDFDDRPFIQEILEKVKKDDVKFADVTSRNVPIGKDEHNSKPGSLYNALIDLSSTIREREKYFEIYPNEKDMKRKQGYKGPVNKVDFSYMVEQMIVGQNSKGHLKFKLRKMSESLYDYMIEEKYKFLHIIDGVDNIAIENLSGESNSYTRMIGELQEFRNEAFDPNCVKLLCGRTRTWLDMHRGQGIARNNFVVGTSEPYQIKHESCCINKILSKRINYLVEGAESTIFTSVLKVFLNADFIMDKELQAQNLNYYHNNMRNFLLNMINLAITVTFRYYQLPSNLRPTFNISKQALIYLKRNRILNGTLFLSNKEDNRECDISNLGRYTFNIFSHDNSNRDWEGLCATRILQLLLKTGGLEDKDIFNSIETMFLYQKISIFQLVNKLKTFGFIDTERINKLNIDNPDYYYEEDAIISVISKKGESILKELYLNVDILYACLLDTRIPVDLLDKKTIQGYSNASGETSHYNLGCFTSVTTFVLLIISCEEKEKEYFNTLSEEKRTVIDRVLDYSTFMLPLSNEKIIDELSVSLCSLYSSSHNKPSEKVEMRKALTIIEEEFKKEAESEPAEI